MTTFNYQKKTYSYEQLKSNITVFMGLRRTREKQYNEAVQAARNKGYTLSILEEKKAELHKKYLSDVENSEKELIAEIDEVSEKKTEELTRKVKEPMKADYFRLLSAISNRNNVDADELKLIREAVGDNYGASLWADEIAEAKGYYVKKAPGYTEMKLNIDNISTLLKAMVQNKTNTTDFVVINGELWRLGSEYDKNLFEAETSEKWANTVKGLENSLLFPSGGIYKLVLSNKDIKLLEDQIAEHPDETKKEIINRLFNESDYFRNIIALSDDYMRLLTPDNNEKARHITEELAALAE